ncbi:hypothetical protein EDB80DRAFT_815264 [Ilyonectria destructans]|nr:hypothetical protein EDB80DRAFT_815264 [Ilyonectria destructans]
MSAFLTPETTDVIICGCGPTGAMLSALLGRYSVSNVVIERDETINSDPRGIALDEDGIRHLQACGIYDKIFTDIGQCMGNFKFVGGIHHDLSTKPFMTMDYNTTEGGTGHVGFICHKQPAIERHLRSKINNYSHSDLRLGSTITSIREDPNWVYATYEDASGKKREVRGKFLVGADGKTGFTRKNYLEPLGISMDTVSQTSYQETWVALNWKISLPTPETHPDFALWKYGYTPQQVYDAFFPTDFRFLCNPKRPAVCGRFGMQADRLWRFEFVVLPGEDGTVMSSPDKIREVVFPYITHPGKKYSSKITQDIQYPTDCIEVLRSRPFNFSARSCNRWARERVILCGDAAHVFPPFGGQGITSGFRDAISLAWRLVIASRQPSGASKTTDYRSLFEGWYTERKQQLDKSLGSTIENGTYLTKSNPIRIFMRDWYLWGLQLVPTWKRWLEQGNRREGMVKYEWQTGKGMAFLPELGGGGNFPQVYCTRLNSAGTSNKVEFTDDLIFSSEKKGLFQVVTFLDSLKTIQATREVLSLLDEASGGAVKGEEATFFVSDTKRPQGADTAGQDGVYRLATAEEFASDKAISTGRPKPLFYDAERIKRDSGHKPFVILRPDRFVFAVCGDREDLLKAAQCLALLISGKN